MDQSAVPRRLGRYEIRHPIGYGADAAMQEGWDTLRQLRVSIRLIALPIPETEEALALLAQLRTDARTLLRLNHPHLATMLDYGEENDTAYLVTEWIDGLTLAEALAETPVIGLADTVRVIQQVSSALDYIHAHGVVHGNISPASIVFTPEGTPKITHFVLSRFVQEVEDAPMEILSRPYLAPERRAQQSFDARADIYAAGALLQRLLTGSVAGAENTEGDGAGEPSANPPGTGLSVPPPMPAMAWPPTLQQVTQRAMAIWPEHRFQTILAFTTALRAALAEDAPSSPASAAPDAPATSSSMMLMISEPSAPDSAMRQIEAVNSARSGTMVRLLALLLAVGCLYAWWDQARWRPLITPTTQDLTLSRPSLPTAGIPGPDAPGPNAPSPGTLGLSATAAVPLPQRLPNQSATLRWANLQQRLTDALDAIPCALPYGDLAPDGEAATLRGLVGSGPSEERLHSAVAAVIPERATEWRMQTFDNRMFCRAINVIRSHAAHRFGKTGANLTLATKEGQTLFADKDTIVISVLTPSVPAYVEIDYLRPDGSVQHLSATEPVLSRIEAPGQTLQIGTAQDGAAAWTVQAPYGKGLIIAIATSSPLYSGKHPATEDAVTYLDALNDAFTGAAGRHDLVLTDAVVIDTAAKR